MPLRLTRTGLASLSGSEDSTKPEENGVDGVANKMIDLAVEEEKAEETRRQMDILLAQKEKFLVMHARMRKLQSQDQWRKFISELEESNKAILDVKAECKSHAEFVKRLDDFSQGEKFDYQLLVIAYNAMDKAEYKKRLASFKTSQERAVFVRRLMEKFEAYEKLSKEEQSKRSFEMTREESREISFGQAAKQDFALNNRTVTLRFTVPKGYTHDRFAVKIPPSAGAPADGPREFVLLKIAGEGKHESKFVRSHHPVRFSIPSDWDKEKYENGDAIGIRLRPNLPVLNVDVPPGLRPGDVILKRLQVETK